LDRQNERRILVRRVFHNTDRELYRLGKLAGIPWFDQFQAKFERDRYAYFSDEEKKDAIERITSVSEVADGKFLEAFNDLYRQERRWLDIPRFVGEHYYFDESSGLALDNKQDSIREDIMKAIEETKERGYFFLKAIVQLHEEEKWDRAYGGATWVDILAKIRELGGTYPPPRDLVVLKSYRIYHKTGSRRYPTHTIPEEILPIVEEVLTGWSRTHITNPKEEAE